MKDSTGDFQGISRLIAEAPPEFEVYSGDDWATFGYLCLGAVGVVSVAAHLVGPQIRQMIELIETGDVPAARKLHESLSPLFNALFVTSNPIPLKAALEMVGPRGGSLACRSCRRPPKSGNGCARHWRTPVSSDRNVRVVFLGGVGEVGRNMACLELDGRILLIDVGLSFPTRTCRASTWCFPISSTCANADRVEAVVLTHGHEDHVGALPYLLRESDASRSTGPRSRSRSCKESSRSTGSPTGASCGPRRRARGRPSGRSRCGSFASRTRSPTGWRWPSTPRFGTILHTGDFKLDQTPIDGRPTDLHGLAEEAAARGVHLLLSDSTNAEEAGLHRQRAERGAGARSDIVGAPEIVVVACFSSHIHRVQQVVDAAPRERAGGGVPRPIDAEQRRRRPAAGLAAGRRPDVIDIAEVDELDPGRVVVICTGSQGEPYSALSLMAAREHKWVKLKEGDTVVLSSSPDPRGTSPRSTAWWTPCTGAAPTCTTCRPTPCTPAATPRRRSSGSCCRSCGRAGSSRSTASAATCSITPGSPRRSASRATTS